MVSWLEGLLRGCLAGVAGPVIGAAIAVMIIGAVRGLPDKEERDAAQGGALPVTAGPAADGHGEGRQAPAG